MLRSTSLLILLMAFATPTFAQDSQLPKTIAESSDFKSTSTSAEVEQLIKAYCDSANHVHQFQFGETVEKRAMSGVVVSGKPYEFGDSDDRFIALVIGNIHSGECAGKEALLMMIRELAENPDHRWLKDMVLIFAPNYNADANDRIGKGNRPGQIGPENGMGRRENAQNLDLNRDFVKIESPEARSLVGLIDKVNPHLFIDCHTTNGSKHRYQLTYDVPHNPAVADPIRSYLRNQVMPTVTSKLAEQGTDTFYYGNFDSEHTKWTTFGYEPRYSTEYVGLRGRFAILSEAYSYISYKDRIFASKKFVASCLDYFHSNAKEAIQVLENADKDLIKAASTTPSRISLPLSARVDKFDEKVTLKGYKDDEPFDYECDFIGDYTATSSVNMPFAYVIPARLPRIVDRLLMHGVGVHKLDAELSCEANVETVKELNRNQRVFQKHKMLQAQTQSTTQEMEFPAGSFIVKTAQPLGRLAAFLLECQSGDGFVFWNFLDAELELDKPYPIVRIDKPTEFNSTPIDAIKNSGKLSLGMIDGLLKFDPAPQWKDKNQIQVELYGRDFLMDAETMSFAAALPPAFESEKLIEKLAETDLKPATAEKIAKLKPLESNDRNWLVFDSSHDFLYQVDTNQITRLGSPDNKAELFNFSPDQSKLAYVNADGLNVLDLQTKTNRLLKADDPQSELIGKLDWVYQEELYGRGNFKGYWFSPDSKTIAFLKLDESPVATFTITDHIPVRGEDEFLNYPKAGDPNPIVAVGMASATGEDAITWTDLSEYDSEEILVSQVSWRPDSSQLLLQVQNREQTYLDLVAVDSLSSSCQRLFRDETPAWIESPGEPHWQNDGNFLWLSPRSGHKHIYQYNPDGSLNKQLTQGNWEVRGITEFDAENNLVYFTAAKEKPFDVDLYCLDIDSESTRKLTADPGYHGVRFNDAKTMFIDSCSGVVRPTVHKLYKSDGSFLRTLNASSDDSWEHLGIVQPEFLQVESGNDQPLDALIIRPPNFDPGKKYPVLIHTYAGPQSPMVRNRFGRSWALWHQALAQQGYIIWKCDNQSASFRSVKNAWPIHRDLGRNELADIEHGIDWLKKQPWVDADRIGIWGWSYGGYMTAYALTHSQSFKIGISGAPVTDWRNYDTIYTERYMGTPQTNPDGYEASSVVKAAANLHGKLLLIHGTIDDNVHLSNSMQFALELQKAGKQFDLMVYPKNRHAIRAKQQAVHLRKLMYDFVLENL